MVSQKTGPERPLKLGSPKSPNPWSYIDLLGILWNFCVVCLNAPLIARCAPTRTEGLNMRGIFRFPIELYLEQLLPSWASPKIQLLEP